MWRFKMENLSIEFSYTENKNSILEKNSKISIKSNTYTKSY